MRVKHADEVQAVEVSTGKDTTIQVLISSQEAPNFALRRFTMQHGGGMPRHTNTVEHEQYILRGQAKIEIGAETFEVQAGDVVLIPEGVVHSYQNLGDDPFEFLCVIPNKTDQITIVDQASC